MIEIPIIWKNNDYSLPEEYQKKVDEKLKKNQKVKEKVRKKQDFDKILTLQHIAANVCQFCKKELPDNFVLAGATRHITSPNPSICDYAFCNNEHADIWNKETYASLAELDENASDSECFEHIKWEGKMRFGRCKITGAEYKVEPLQPSENSGQPKECTEHFELKKQYRKYL